MNEIERFENLQTTIKLNPGNFQARRELIMLCLDLGFEKVALSHIKYLLDIFFKYGFPYDSSSRKHCIEISHIISNDEYKKYNDALGKIMIPFVLVKHKCRTILVART